ncbi:MAG: ACT domain-containing protein [Anaerolineales bacterium]|jgi:hypothetical protein
MNLTLLPDRLAVCRLEPNVPYPGWLPQAGLLSVTRTTDELSVVCLESAVPAGVTMSGGWRALQVEGPLDFSLVGVLAEFSGALAEAGVSIFAVSTYDTDYVLVREDQLSEARHALAGAGHAVV